MHSALSQFIRGFVCNCFVGLNISCHSFAFSQSHAQVSNSLTNVSGLAVAVSDLHCSLSVLWSVFIIVNSLLKVLIAVVLSVSLLNACDSFRSRCASNVRDGHCHNSSNVFSWLRNDKIGKRFSHTYLQVWMLVCRGSSHTWLVVLVVMISCIMQCVIDLLVLNI